MEDNSAIQPYSWILHISKFTCQSSLIILLHLQHSIQGWVRDNVNLASDLDRKGTIKSSWNKFSTFISFNGEFCIECGYMIKIQPFFSRMQSLFSVASSWGSHSEDTIGSLRLLLVSHDSKESNCKRKCCSFFFSLNTFHNAGKYT